MKTGRLTVVEKHLILTATQLSITGEESLRRTCYLMVLNILKATEEVDARTRTLQDKVSSANAFFSSSKRVGGLSNPLQPSSRPVAPFPARRKSKRAVMERTEG